MTASTGVKIQYFLGIDRCPACGFGKECGNKTQIRIMDSKLYKNQKIRHKKAQFKGKKDINCENKIHIHIMDNKVNKNQK